MGNGSPAFQAAQSRNAIKILSEAGFKGKNSYRTNPAKAMIWAMNEIATVANLEAIVQLLLENGAPVDTVNKDKCTFLHVAARHGKLRVAHILIQKGAKVNATRNSVFALKSDWTPLKYAFWFDKPTMMRLLLRNGADINHQPDTHERTLLHEAIEDFQNRGSHIPMLLAHGASLTIKDSQSRTPFHLAVINGNLPVARALLEAGADVEAVAKPGQKALSFAIESANAEMVTFLVQNGEADVHSACDGYVCALMHAVKKADGYVLEALLNKSTASADVNRTDTQGRTCLHILSNATATDIFDLLDLLIDNGADVGIEDRTGSTPLHEAAKAGSSVMVSSLLHYRADQHVQNHAGKTPLDLAKAKRHKEVVEILGGTLKKKGLFRRS
jgi:ankyrin